MRIITGRAKGLRLKTPKNFLTRPTSDRIKESLFGILSGLIDFSEVDKVLDIFAGTGALGLEALSRGANSAIFIDVATSTIISENIQRTRFENCRNLRGDYDKILHRLSKENLIFDLIFSDPPYGKGLGQASLNLVMELGLLKIGGLMIIEQGFSETIKSEYEIIRAETYGRTTAIKIIERKS